MRLVKGLVIALSLMLVMGLAVGCGGAKKEETKPAAQAPAPAPAPAAEKTTLDEIKAKGVIVIGTSNDVPFSYIDKDTKELMGIDAEIMKYIAGKMGVKIETYTTDFSTLVAALKQKKFDIIVDAMYITEKRQAEINFTTPWYKEGEGLVVRKESTIKSIDDVKGKVVGAQTGTTFLDYAKTLPTKELKIYDSQATALLDLNNKRVDAVITDSATAAYSIVHDSKLQLKLVTPYTTHFPGTIGAGIRKEDTTLLDEVNKHLADLKKEGKDLEILKKYGLNEDNRLP